jgi:DNA-binding response OmpR family regulator
LVAGLASFLVENQSTDDFSVLTAPYGEQRSTYWDAQPPTSVLLDVVLPECWAPHRARGCRHVHDRR